MPRYRKLHTKTLESLDINDMPDDFCRLFWTLLPLVLCREGRGLNSAAWLRSKLFPLREDVSGDQVQAALDWCVNRGMIVPYTVEDRDYFYVPSFHKYQGNTTKEAESDYPAPQSQVQTNSEPTPELVQSKSASDAVFSIQYSDADADAEAISAAVADALKSIKMGQITTVIKEAANAGLTAEQVIDTCEWAKEEGKDAALVRSMFRLGEANRPRAPDYGRKRYMNQKSIPICEKCYQHPCACEDV